MWVGRSGCRMDTVHVRHASVDPAADHDEVLEQRQECEDEASDQPHLQCAEAEGLQSRLRVEDLSRCGISEHT